MAGEGSRFSKAGWTTPKPLIMLKGKPLFLHAVKSIDLKNIPIKYSFIVRQEHIKENNIDAEIKKYFSNASVFSVEKTTRGAVETCLLAEKNIDNNDGILVLDCDLEFKSKDFDQYIQSELSKPADKATGGALVSFKSDDSRYSYATVDSKMHVIRTAEKEVISNHALCGAYFFSNGAEFKTIAHELLSKRMEKNEFYTSLLFNKMIARNEPVLLCNMEKYYSYGTPEELKRYL